MRVITMGVPILLLLACASNPSPAPARSVNARGVFYCGVGVMESEGFALSRPASSSPDGGFAMFYRESAGRLVYYSLYVRRRDIGAIDVQVRSSRWGSASFADRLKHTITASCFP